ncbi:uncharacterized protein DUF1311 [Reinekea marinisedimentorum]|uniref:Uncharacterized protein DUF1311 n=1 Tax=Reinekea marinisedimentorum TaxID=230495 RepID=A0A4R3HR82_9GAMM|nr:uncharacterized protein DUF1311 [Reinekea marinisedimentorum]
MIRSYLKSFSTVLLLTIGCSFSYAVAPASEDLNGRPSFNCSKASTEVEKSICSSSSVAALDVVLSKVYKKILAAGFDEVRETQRAWLKERDRCLHDETSGWLREPLAKCYSDRIEELQSQYSIDLSDEEYLNVAKLILKTVISENATDGEKFIYISNFKVFAGNLYENLCWYIPEYITFENDYFLSTAYSGSQTCGGSSFPVNGSINYCKASDGKFVKGDVWSCREHSTNVEILISTIDSNLFSEFTPSGSNWVPREFDTNQSSRNKIIPYLYSKQIHILSSPSFFSEGFIRAIDENLATLKKVLGFPEQEIAYLMSGMKCTYELVTSNDNWESIFKSKPPGRWGKAKGYYWYGQQFSGCDTFDKRIENEMYTEKELFILLWQRFYTAKTMDIAISMLDRELSEQAK